MRGTRKESWNFCGPDTHVNQRQVEGRAQKPVDSQLVNGYICYVKEEGK